MRLLVDSGADFRLFRLLRFTVIDIALELAFHVGDAPFDGLAHGITNLSHIVIICMHHAVAHFIVTTAVLACDFVAHFIPLLATRLFLTPPPFFFLIFLIGGTEEQPQEAANECTNRPGNDAADNAANDCKKSTATARTTINGKIDIDVHRQIAHRQVIQRRPQLQVFPELLKFMRRSAQFMVNRPLLPAAHFFYKATLRCVCPINDALFNVLCRIVFVKVIRHAFCGLTNILIKRTARIFDVTLRCLETIFRLVNDSDGLFLRVLESWPKRLQFCTHFIQRPARQFPPKRQRLVNLLHDLETLRRVAMEFRTPLLFRKEKASPF